VKSEYYFDLIESSAHTQLNESFNSIKARIASKSYAWRSSFAARTAITVLQFNKLFTWYLDVVNDLNIPYSQNEMMVLGQLLQATSDTKNSKKGKRQFKLNFIRKTKKNHSPSKLEQKQIKSSIHLKVPKIGDFSDELDDFASLQSSDSESELDEHNDPTSSLSGLSESALDEFPCDDELGIISKISLMSGEVFCLHFKRFANK
jgi:hypothetical protein